MSQSTAAVMERMIYGRPSASKAKPIPTATEVQTYDPLKSLVDSKFARTRQRRTKAATCACCPATLRASEVHVCASCADELLGHETMGRVRAEGEL